MMSLKKELLKLMSLETPLNDEEFKAQLNILKGFKDSIGIPMRVLMHLAPSVPEDLKEKVAVSVEHNVVQPLLDKKALPCTLGDSSKKGIYKPLDEWKNFLRLCGDDFTDAELKRLQPAFGKLNTMVATDIFRAKKEFYGDSERLEILVSMMKETLLRDVKGDSNPYDDLQRWSNEDIDGEIILDNLGHLSFNYSKVLLAGIFFYDEEDDVYRLIKSSTLFKYAAKLRRKDMFKDLKAKLIRFAGKYKWIVKKLFVELDPTDKKDQKFFTNIINKLPKKAFASYNGSRDWTEDMLDFASFSSSNSIGKLAIPKRKDYHYSFLMYLLNPMMDTADVKRTIQSAVHFAVDLGEKRKEYIPMYSELPNGTYRMPESSSQAVIAIPIDCLKGFPALSKGWVSNKGNGVLVDKRFKELYKNKYANNAKFNAGAIKSKGIGIWSDLYEATFKDGSKMPVDLVFDVQGSRRLKKALFAAGTLAMKAYREGKKQVTIPRDIEIEDSSFELVEAKVNGVPCFVTISETSIDLSVDRSSDVRMKSMLYAQEKATSPDVWQQLQSLLDSHCRKNQWEIRRIINAIETISEILTRLDEEVQKSNAKSIDRMKAWKLKAERARAFGKIFKKHGASVPKGLKFLEKLVKDKVRWEDTRLTDKEIKMVLEAVDSPITIRGIELLPSTYLIKHEGVTMMAPELRMLLEIVVNERKGGNFTFNHLYEYLDFMLKRTKIAFTPKLPVVSGRMATGAFERGAVVPFKFETIDRLLQMNTTLSKEQREDLIAAGPDAVNKVLSQLTFRLQRDPVLKKIPAVKVTTAVLPEDVIIVGYKDAQWIGGDDDDDIVCLWWFGIPQLRGNLLRGVFEEAVQNCPDIKRLDPDAYDKEAEIANFLVNYRK